jgi:hypothetical protein
MRVLVSIDDTDNLESRGTGELASLIAEELEANGWGKAGFVTRHQLLVHPDIPYTSHNSAMCFTAEIADGAFEKIIAHAAAFLERESAPDSDPGLCVAAIDSLANPELLITFGRRAKEEVLTKDDAYALAASLGVRLSEHGGTGHGVIGALAGAALRLGGNDGRLKGTVRIPAGRHLMTVAELLELPEVEQVASLKSDAVAGDDLVHILDDKVKTVMRDGLSVLLLAPAEPDGTGALWQTLHRKELRRY